jgi:hypothetical protein
MKIELSYQDKTVTLPGFNHQVTWTAGIKSEDQSGDTSSTAESYKGYKAVLVSVTMAIRQHDLESLQELARTFYAAKDAKPLVYNLIHKELNAFGVNQVKFIDDLRISPDGIRKAYAVTLTLKEERSDPEITEGRTAIDTAATKQPDGTAIASFVNLETASAPGTFEQILSKMNQFLGDTFFK